MYIYIYIRTRGCRVTYLAPGRVGLGGVPVWDFLVCLSSVCLSVPGWFASDPPWRPTLSDPPWATHPGDPPRATHPGRPTRRDPPGANHPPRSCRPLARVRYIYIYIYANSFIPGGPRVEMVLRPTGSQAPPITSIGRLETRAKVS